jgi:hypothetical protein
VALRAIWTLWELRHLLSFRRSGLFAWQLLSHKMLRYLAFAFAVGAYALNLPLAAESGFYRLTLVAQTAFYVAAALHPLLRARGVELRLPALCCHLVVMNAAAAHALAKFLAGRRVVVWTPRLG